MLIESFRFAAWVLFALVALIAGHHLRRISIDPTHQLGRMQRVRVALGVTIMAGGLAVHQCYWWTWQVAVRLANGRVSRGLEASADITSLAYLVIFAGCGLVISPWTERVVGRLWTVVTFGAVALLLGASAIARM